MTASALLRVLAWLLLAGLVFVTLSPSDLRPASSMPVPLELVAAPAFIGLVFAVAYPRHLWLVAVLVLGSTIILELLQLVAPGRHARVTDVLLKLAGATLGLAIGWLTTRPRPRS